MKSLKIKREIISLRSSIHRNIIIVTWRDNFIQLRRDIDILFNSVSLFAFQHRCKPVRHAVPNIIQVKSIRYTYKCT